MEAVTKRNRLQENLLAHHLPKRHVETGKGITAWDGVKVAIYSRRRVKELPKEQRGKKEAQL